jgi:hypothetical protein
MRFQLANVWLTSLTSPVQTFLQAAIPVAVWTSSACRARIPWFGPVAGHPYSFIDCQYTT